MSILFSELKIKELTLKNRMVISPMCQYSAENGYANNWHLVHLGSRAVGGAGLVMQEATAVLPEGRISYADLGLWEDGQIEKLREITDFVHAQDTAIGIQLAHAGRKASCDKPWTGAGKQIQSGENSWRPVAPSALPFHESDVSPYELKVSDIQEVVMAFNQAAARAVLAGYDVLEIHAAHGYLIHQFMSPLSNKRTDLYGGSFENRIRLLIDVVEAVQAVWPEERPLFVRISATDWAEGGWNLDQSIQLAAVLKDRGVDLIDTSTGGLVPYAVIPAAPNYQVPFAKEIRKAIQIKTGAVGMITNAKQAEETLEGEKADLIFIGRETLRDPYFALHAAKILGDNVAWPAQYERAKL